MKLEQIDLSISLQDVAKGLDNKPGVYIFSEDDKILYVGKARNLRKRVSSYVNITRLDNKGRRLMEKANRLQWVITASNTEALLLEFNFIKKHKPPYNITLRDDKSYPFIYLSSNHKFPLLISHRGSQKKQGDYFGPYPNATAVHRSIAELQKIFQIRSCSDSFFANRKRPCLQHQIGRCSAPCVNGISQEDYAKNVSFVRDFLSGKDSKVLKELTNEMEQASQKLRFEKAAQLRDKVQAMRNLSEKQYVNKAIGNLDALAVYSHGNNACIYLIKVRQGNLTDSRPFFFKAPAFDNEESLLQSFISQYYLRQDSYLPHDIITSVPVASEVFADLGEHYKKKINYKHMVRGTRRRWLSMAEESCKSLLINHLNNRYTFRDDMEELSQKFNIPLGLSRIECFDISHSGGRQTQASCVAFTAEGASKQDYRRFNLDGITAGDDYAAMKQTVIRRYKKMQYQDEGLIILIDGGLGQLKYALQGLYEIYAEAEKHQKLKDCAFMHNSILIGVAKDKDRKFGKEKLLVLNQYLPMLSEEQVSAKIQTIELSSLQRNSSLDLLLKVRDEAHRFAITGHRRKRNATAMTSSLDKIKGLGESRKSELIRYFGGISPIKNASIEELARVPGFGRKLANTVFEQLHR